MLAATNVTANSVTSESATNSRTYSGITQYNYLSWYTNGNYRELFKQSSWWHRSYTNYSVKDAYMYGSEEGSGTNGYPTSCSEDWAIGTPTFYSLDTASYTQYFSSCPYVYYDPNGGYTGSVGSFARADI